MHLPLRAHPRLPSLCTHTRVGCHPKPTSGRPNLPPPPKFGDTQIADPARGGPDPSRSGTHRGAAKLDVVGAHHGDGHFVRVLRHDRGRWSRTPEAQRAPWALACGPDVPGISALGTRAHTVPSAWASPELPTPPWRLTSALPSLSRPSSGERARLPTQPPLPAPSAPLPKPLVRLSVG